MVSLVAPRIIPRPISWLMFTAALAPEDVVFLTPKFWQMHLDPIVATDGAATTLLTIQFNLAAGTLAPYALERPELMPLLKKILNFDVKYANIKS
jgi:acyl-CoA oxidase